MTYEFVQQTDQKWLLFWSDDNLFIGLFNSLRAAQLAQARHAVTALMWRNEYVAASLIELELEMNQ
jgi:hypothetical protein